MKAVMIRTNERTSDRFERLCEHLGTLDSAESMDKTFAHLVIWYLRWGGDDDLDSGIWFDVTLARVGRWSEYPSAMKFGNALAGAGYVRPLSDFFPRAVIGDRDGLFVPTTLDETWRSVHSRRGNAADLVPFIQNRERRALAATKCGIPMEAFDGWLHPPDPGGDVSHDVSQDASRPVTPPPYTSLNVNKTNEEIQRNVGNSRRIDGRTAFAKTADQLQFIRENKYDNPLACLKRLDSGRTALRTWHEALSVHAEGVVTKLAEITETDNAWLALENPAAVLMKHCKSIIRGAA